MGTRVVPFFLAGLGGHRTFAWSLDYFAGADALRTCTDSAGSAVYECSDALQVGIPASVGFVVCVANVVSENRPLATDITYSGHGLLQ